MAELSDPQPDSQAVAWHRDVLALVPPTDEILRLESVSCLAADSSPLMKLALWHPTDKVEQFIREFLLEFGHELMVPERKSLDRADRGAEVQQYLQLKEFAFRDAITGLYNHRFFSIRLEEEVSRHRRFNHPVSMVLVELDGFEALNDELGHPAGNETLRGMAEILVRHSRGINVISRYDGRLFAVLLVETSVGGARLYADRIRYVLSSSQFIHRRRVTASFGIASLPESATPTSEELIQAADQALYTAKRTGKNRIAVYEAKPRE